ncbi:MAG: hypothetical protein Q7S26_01970 [bacterium]|nr:hypothetical protein [bacterium]
MQPQQLTQTEYDRHLVGKTFRLAFIGMSNVGKSYRSKVLQDECGFMGYHVDEEIQKALGFDSIDAISHWLGYPSGPDYSVREQEYLAQEAQSTKVDFLDTKGKNLVFDTTGSVIYLGEPILEWLKENSLLIHLDAGEEALGAMVEKFFEEPKPLIWHGFFDQREGESEHEALERCYPKLLHDRLAKYRALAHITISAEQLRDKNGAETLEIIKSYLPV